MRKPSTSSVSTFAVKIFKEYVKCIKMLRWVIIVLWVVIDFLGLMYGLKFFDETTTTFVAPPGSTAAKATSAINEYFPSQKGITWASLYIQSISGESLYSGDLGAKMKEFSGLLYNESRLLNEFYSFSDYYLYDTLSVPLYEITFVSTVTDTVTIIAIGYDATDDVKAHDFCNELSDIIDNLQVELGLYQNEVITLERTGLTYFEIDSMAAVKEDSAMMDQYVAPAAFIVLAIVIQNLPIMIIPMFTIISTILFQFLIMYPVALRMDVIAFVPSLMLSLTFATSIDYSLFLLARYCEEQRLEKDMDDSILVMMESSGVTILMSGSTLMVCFLGLLFFDLELLQSVGIGAATTLFTVILCNLTLLPACLYTFGKQIAYVHSIINVEYMPYVGSKGAAFTTPEWMKRMFGKPRSNSDVIFEDFDYDNRTNPILINDENALLNPVSDHSNVPKFPQSEENLFRNLRGLSGDSNNNNNLRSTIISINTGVDLNDSSLDVDDGEEMSEIMKSFWYRFGSFLLVKWKGVLFGLLIIILMIPADLYCLSVKSDVDFVTMVPTDCSSYRAYEGISEYYFAGLPAPYRVLYEAEDGRSLYSDEGFNDVRSATEYLIDNLNYIDLSSFFGGYMINGSYVTYDDMSDAVSLRVNNSESRAYRLMYAQFFAEKNTTEHPALYAFLYLDINPYSFDGTYWLRDARDLAPTIKEKYRINIYFADGASATDDAVDSVYKQFPTMIIVTLSLVFLLIAVSFWSISVPLRLVGTIILTLAFVYGLCVLTYQHGIFAWMNTSALDNYGGIAWLAPVMCFTIIVGLGLDYDVFLIGRVLEYREQGYSSDGSILKGIYKTGYIITDAGIIMAIAFSGLFLSREVALNQIAFLLVVSVLLDTFIVRTVLVPILMSLAGNSAWWPRAIPYVGMENTYGFKDTSTPKLLKRFEWIWED